MPRTKNPARKGKRGRPSAYSEALAERICEAIACGSTLVAVCKRAAMPPLGTVLRWLSDRPDFRAVYEQAKTVRLAVLAEELLTIADTSRLGHKSKRTEVGRAFICPVCSLEVKWHKDESCWKHQADSSVMCPTTWKPKFMPVYETEVVTSDTIERSKLMVQTRQWLLAHLAADVYGDRIAAQLSGPNGGPIEVNNRVMALAEALTPEQLQDVKRKLQAALVPTEGAQR